MFGGKGRVRDVCRGRQGAYSQADQQQRVSVSMRGRGKVRKQGQGASRKGTCDFSCYSRPRWTAGKFSIEPWTRVTRYWEGNRVERKEREKSWQEEERRRLEVAPTRL